MKRRINMEAGLIRNAICKVIGIEPRMLKSKTRDPIIVISRQFFYYFVKQIKPLISLSKLGDYFGQSHSNVMHSLKSINNRLETSNEVRTLRQDIVEMILDLQKQHCDYIIKIPYFLEDEEKEEKCNFCVQL